MGNKNYTNYSKPRPDYVPPKAHANQNGQQKPVVKTETAEEQIPVVETEPVKEQKIGVVTDCLVLNVREAPSTDAPVVCTINASTEIVIDEEETTDTFYKICTAAGVEGFCMKRYITLVP